MSAHTHSPAPGQPTALLADGERPSSRRRAEQARHPHYLIAIDETGVPELETVLSTLPLCARGRVFIEIESESDVFVVDVPSRMTVTWLARSRRSGLPGSGQRCVRGDALTRAVTAWSDEMFCDENPDVSVWLGGSYRSVSGCYDHLTTRRSIDANRITVPLEYHLR